MKYYFFSFLLLICATVLVLTIPFLLQFSEKYLIVFEIPKTAAVAGIQKYNIPPQPKNIPIPVVSAKSVLIKDLSTGTDLYQKNANTQLPIASTTKIMTALVGTGYYKANSVLIVNAAADVPGSRMGLLRGETLSFRSLLYGMLLPSGNDAAFAIAENYPGGVKAFVAQMNKKASDLGLFHTHFDNPAGFDSINHYSSANDMEIITEEALKSYELSRIFATKDTDVVSLDKRFNYKLSNLNKLLSSVSGVLGVKTGYTQEAKENLVTLVERNGHRVLFVVLGSDDRFGESTKFIDWAYSNFQWQDN